MPKFERTSHFESSKYVLSLYINPVSKSCSIFLPFDSPLFPVDEGLQACMKDFYTDSVEDVVCGRF